MVIPNVATVLNSEKDLQVPEIHAFLFSEEVIQLVRSGSEFNFCSVLYFLFLPFKIATVFSSSVHLL